MSRGRETHELQRQVDLQEFTRDTGRPIERFVENLYIWDKSLKIKN